MTKAHRIIAPSSLAALHRMQAAKPQNTLPELKIRSRLFKMGLRYRIAAKPILNFNRSADIVFSVEKIAIFIDGCFWHGCPIHGSQSKSNSRFWKTKIKTNKLRDIETTKKFEKEGWLVIRVWEHEDPSVVANYIFSKVLARRAELSKDAKGGNAPKAQFGS